MHVRLQPAIRVPALPKRQSLTMQLQTEPVTQSTRMLHVTH
jgi:hypothetical protein